MGLLVQPGTILAPAVAAALLAIGCFVGYTASHLGPAGGSLRLFTVWAAGTALTLVAGVGSSMALRLPQPGWVVVWALLATVFFLGATLDGWHRVQAARRTTLFFVALLQGPPAERGAGWLRYGRWAPLVRRATEVEEELCRFQRRLARGYRSIILQYSPDRLGQMVSLQDPYALMSSSAQLERVRRRLDGDRRAARELSVRVRKELLPARDSMSSIPFLDRAFATWAVRHVCNRSEALVNAAGALLHEEHELLDQMERQPDRFTVDGTRLVSTEPTRSGRSTQRYLSTLETRIERFKTSLRCHHEP